MPIYKCEKCNKEFSFKNDYRRHINRKFSCIKEKITYDFFECPRCHNHFNSIPLLQQHIDNSCPSKKIMPPMPPVLKVNKETNQTLHIIDAYTFQCDKCKKIFTRSDNLKKHKAKYCYNESNKKIEEMTNKELADQILELKNEIDLMKKEKLNSNINNINNNVNSNNVITQNINNDIKMIAFGKEDLFEMLTDDEAIKYIKKGYQSVYHLIEDMHFNPNRPDLHNVYISDISRNKAITYNGERWDTVEKVDVVEQLFDDKACYLNAMFKELKNRLDKKTIIKYSNFMNDTDQDTIDNLKKDIRQLLYNKRHIPMNTKKKMK